MKKILNVLFIFIIILSCFACDEHETNNDNTNNGGGDTDVLSSSLKLWYDEETPKDHEGNGVANYWPGGATEYQNDFGWTYWSLPIGNGYFGVNTFGLNVKSKEPVLSLSK